ncbi:hypothetical protein L483_06935 [Pseudomonas putida H8234]|nr:hypothetical protein L483_06935 [Pseudomonas putida H8234]
MSMARAYVFCSVINVTSVMAPCVQIESSERQRLQHLAKIIGRWGA